MKKALFIILLLLSNCLFAQSQINSLEFQLPSKQGIKKVEVLNKLAYAYWNVSPDKGLKYAKMAYSLALKENSKENIAKSLQIIGVNYWAKSEFQLALKNYQKSLKIYEEINNQNGICSLLSNIGIVYKDLSDYKNALKCYLKSLKISEENGYTHSYIKIIGNISSIYLAQENYSKALEYIEEAIDLSEKEGGDSYLSAQLNTLGQIYEAQEDHEKAKATYIKTLVLNKQNKNNYGTTISLYNIGNSEYQLKNYNSALKYFKESHLLSEKINDQFGVLLANKSIGLIHKEQLRFGSADLYYKKAFKLALILDAKEELLDIYKIQSDLHKDIGNLDKSLVYLEKYIALKDSVYNKNRSKQIAEMQTKYDSEKKDKENELLRKNSLIQELAIEKQTNLRNSFILISLVILVLIIILLYQFVIKKKANQLLIQKNDVISKQRDELKESNSTKDKFFGIISHDLRSPFNNILGITSLLVEDYDEIDDAEKKELITSLNISSKLAFNLLTNLLTWARTQTGRIKINKERINLKILIEMSIAPYSRSALEKDIQITVNIPSEAILSIDKNTAITFISNLVNNAIKFTPQGGKVTINYKENKDTIELHFIDNGVGIDSKVIEELFRIDSNISTKGTNNEIGTGLGLILCKEFITKNGGNISVTSEVEKGTTFIVTLLKEK
ncbi:tetratricopeptide repeat-containing sensor histidine kinase [Flavobacterium sp. 7A]|uniref:tetratricopeptide repeat-containing sensor histidine kinase n=1 Tax=Flavobacterium sp. 7A TaxID=2940571 RepID=UPI0022276CD9|nr:tetratricopeptide repeat-containing sensor histidine kinase [Flavobacterium sp. 7A]MCW2118475.1 signal transduction histidine kinase/Flp pilus assembly protein TadD [Flavobacterium sp. 7A]